MFKRYRFHLSMIVAALTGVALAAAPDFVALWHKYSDAINLPFSG
jgi:hypothetical protein